MAELLSSKVLLTEEPPKFRLFPALSSSVTGIVGTAAWGPIGVPTLCTSLEEFDRTFGGYLGQFELALSARLFFSNGGRQLYVVRTCHYASANDAESMAAKAAQGDVAAEQGVFATISARYPGAFGNTLRIDVSNSGNDIEIEVGTGGRRRELLSGLSNNPKAARYYLHVVNAQSRFIRMKPGVQDARLAEGRQAVALIDGDDGLAQLSDADYIGHPASKTGLHALDTVLDLSLVAIPGACTQDVHRALLAYCEETRGGSVYSVLDPPSHASAQDITKYVADDARLLNHSAHGSIYWPRLLVANPEGAGVVTAAPSGAIAGTIARLVGNAAGGVYLPPAGLEAGRLLGVVGFDHSDTLEEAKRDLVFPVCVNPLTTAPGRPFYIDGSRTLAPSSNFPWLAWRRGASHIERDLRLRLDYLRHRPLNSALQSEAYRTMRSYLVEQMRHGAFASNKPSEAFSIYMVPPTRTATLEMAVGLSFAAPAEFIWVHLSINLGGAANDKE